MPADDDDDETCGFCIFMKAGGCKDEFQVGLAASIWLSNGAMALFLTQAWSKCVDDERKDGKDFTEECKDMVQPFIHFMQAVPCYHAIHQRSICIDKVDCM